jgi:homeobox protein cut-like
MLAILTGQRDRYRQKNLELEEAQRALQQQIAATKNELEALRVDNVKLYEKLQYTESFGKPAPSRSQARLLLLISSILI